MATYSYKPGLGNAASFQVAGTPFVSGNIQCAGAATVALAFPTVTQWIVVGNAGGGDLKVAFSANGLDSGKDNYLIVPSGSMSPRLEVKATQLFLNGGTNGRVSVMAGLSSIQNEAINNSQVSPSGSNWSGSVGALVG